MMILTLWPGVARAGGDTTGPNFETGYPKTGDVQADGSKQVEIVFKADESGNYYYVILPTPSFAPTAEQIKSGLITGVLSSSVGDYVYENEIIFTTDPGTLENGKNYDFYMVLEDNEKNLGAVTKMAITTPAGVTPPTFADGYPKQHGDSHHPGCKRVTMTVAPQEGEVTAYYVAVEHGAEPPSNSQVKVGIDSSDQVAIVSGSQDKVKSNGYIINSKKLPADDTTYDFWFVLEDIDGKLSEPKKVELKTPIKLLTDGYPQMGAVQAAGSKQVEILVKANGSATAYYVAVAGDPAPSYGHIENGQDGEGKSALAAGSMELDANKQASAIMNLPADDTDYDIYLVLHKDYHGGGFIDDIWSEVVKLDVKTPEASSSGIWEVSNATDLENALSGFQDEDTIKLMANIDYDKGIVINAKSFRLDLGSYTLDVVNSTGIGIDIKDAILTVSGDGKLNATGTKGVQAHNSKISVYSATGTAGAGVEASCSSYAGGAPCEVTVTTLAQGTTAGAYAMNNNCKIIAGSAKATAIKGRAVYAEVGGTVEISGNVDAPNGYGVYCVNSSATIGGSVTSKNTAAYLWEKGSIVINGNVNADNGSGTAVEIDGNGIPSNGTVTIGGKVSASDAFYVRFVNRDRAKNEGVPDGDYLKYMDSIDGEKAGIIRVKKVPAVCTIGAQEFTSLSEAIAAAPEGKTTTITLLQSITHNEPVEINGKDITFALGGFDLTIDTSAVSNSTGLHVKGDGKVNCTGSGKFNVVGSNDGIRASGGSELHISGNVTARQYAVTAGSAPGTGTPKITVDGDVTVTGQDVNAWSEVEAVSVGGYATVTIGGNVTANRTDEMQLVTAVYSNASTITIGKNVTTQGNGVNAQNGGNVTIGGALNYNPIGSGDQAYIKVGYPVVLKTADDFEPTSIKPEYKEYRNGDNVVWVKEAPAVCTIGAQKFTSLDAAIASVPAGGRATITLLHSINHTKHIMVEKKIINLDLMDYDLLLDTSADTSYSPALMVIDGGKVNLIGSGTGEFNIKSYMTAISVGGIDSRATVHNVVAGDSTGVNMVGSGDYLDSNSTVTVLGSIKVGNGNGIDVNAKGGRVLVGGEIRAGRIGVAVWSNPGTYVTVKGDITVDSFASMAGIRAYGDTNVDVTGNVTVRGTDCVGVHASGSRIQIDGNVMSSGTGVHCDSKGGVEITGSLTAGTPFITFGTTEMTADEGIETDEGYLLYSYGSNTVQIGNVGGSAPTYIVTVTSGSGSGSYAKDAIVTITAATVADGIRFKEWKSNPSVTFVEGTDKTSKIAKFIMPAQNVSVEAIFEPIPVASYHVTVNGSYAETSGAGSYTPNATVTINAGTRSGYSFNGWTSSDGLTFANADSETTTFTMPAKNVTITANWKNSSGGSSGGGGGGTPQPSVPTIDAVVKAGSYQQNYPITLNKSGNFAIANLSSEDFNTAIEKAKADSDGLKTVNIILPSVQDTNSYVLGLPTSALAGNGNNNINMSSELGSLILPSNMLNNIGIEDEKNIEISITKADKSILPQDLQNQIGDRPVIAFKLKQGEKTIAWNNPTAPVLVTIPYTPTEQELLNPEHITVWYIDGNGNVFSVPSGRYNPDTGMVTFNITHFSNYAVVYISKTFDDLGNVAWAKKPIEVLTTKGILEGISDTKYDPHTNITRADFLYFLIRTLSVEATFDENFADINSDAYYYKEIGVAKKLGITSGVGSNQFSPDSKISRQDMIALTERALRMFKDLKEADETSDLDKFTDKSLIAGYALNSVATLVNKGLIEGSNNQINPKGNTTRAEAAVFLYKIYNKY